MTHDHQPPVRTRLFLAGGVLVFALGGYCAGVVSGGAALAATVTNSVSTAPAAPTVTNSVSGLTATAPAMPTLTAAPVNTNRGSISLAWQKSPDASVTGYAVYLGLTNGPLNRYDVGNKTNATIGGLIEGATYRSTVKAYDVFGAESPDSNEVRWICPARTFLRFDRVAIESYGVMGRTNAIQETTNLVTWTDAVVWVGDGKLRGIVRTNLAGSAASYRTVPK